MNLKSDAVKRYACVLLFGAAMAWMEAATVLYLRKLVGRLEPYQADPFPAEGILGTVEMIREGATLAMLLAVGMLAGRTWRSRVGFTAVAFGVWDIFYYLFLREMCGWPRSLMDWDILFLLPLPWWGPVLAPILISLLMILWGTLVIRSERALDDAPPRIWSWLLNSIGIGLALFIFMVDALHAAPRGADALRHALPARFNWPLFCLALALMSAPVVDRARVIMRVSFARKHPRIEAE